jgi:hypothetical protein
MSAVLSELREKRLSYDAEQVPRMALSGEDTQTRLAPVFLFHAPYPHTCVVGG